MNSLRLTKKRVKIESGFSDITFRLFVFFTMVITFFVALYPFVYIFSNSISDPMEVVKGRVWLFPKGLSLVGYRTVLENSGLFRAYLNTIFYTVMGTLLSLVLSTLAAYPLSRNYLFGRRILNIFIVIPLLFTGGIIPLYIVVRALGLINSRWAVILPVAVRSFYVILMLNFFRAIPESLHDSGRIDGCTEWQVLLRIVLPLSKPILATIGVYTAVDRWNDFFIPLVFIRDNALQPLTLLLRRLLIQGDVSAERDVVSVFLAPGMIKSAAVIATILPIIFVYPFAQKYFVKGSLLGAVKQ
jgi:putative aldouronate transport system permease protein